MKEENKKVTYKKPEITPFGSVSEITQSNMKEPNVLDNSKDNNQYGSNNV